MAGTSEGSKKSAQTTRERYGDDFHTRIGKRGGSKHGRGYFGKLKEEGKSDELKDLAKKAAYKSNKLQAQRKKAEQRRTDRVLRAK